MTLDQARERIEKCIAAGVFSLNEDEAKGVFRLLGMPVVAERVALNLDEVLAAGDALGYPVVLKGMGKDILHKTEAGLVMVGIPSRQRLEEAVAEMRRRAGKALESFLVQPMVQGKRELVAGLFRDEQFGPVVMFGLGGVLTEALEDVVFRVAPLSGVDLEDMVNGLAAQKLLGPFRGRPPLTNSCSNRCFRGCRIWPWTVPRCRRWTSIPSLSSPTAAPWPWTVSWPWERLPHPVPVNFTMIFAGSTPAIILRPSPLWGLRPPRGNGGICCR